MKFKCFRNAAAAGTVSDQGDRFISRLVSTDDAQKAVRPRPLIALPFDEWFLTPHHHKNGLIEEPKPKPRPVRLVLIAQRKRKREIPVVSIRSSRIPTSSMCGKWRKDSEPLLFDDLPVFVINDFEALRQIPHDGDDGRHHSRKQRRPDDVDEEAVARLFRVVGREMQ